VTQEIIIVAVVGTMEFLNLIKIFPQKIQKGFKSPFRMILNYFLKKGHFFSNFSFVQSQKELQDYTGSLSDTLIEERRSELWKSFYIH